MPTIRAVLQVPPDSGTERAIAAHGSILGRLMAVGADFHVTDRKGYDVTTPGPGRAVFEPGAWMLFCRTGVWPVQPVDVRLLKPGDGLMGFTSGQDDDIYDAVLVLKYRPQMCGDSIRLVPDPAKVIPAGIAFGITYVTPPQLLAWKYVPARQLAAL